MSMPLKSPWLARMSKALLLFFTVIRAPICGRVTPAGSGVPSLCGYQLRWIALSALAVGTVSLVEQVNRAPARKENTP